MRILFISPHLSTGGLPQYLLKSIESLKENEIYCVEFTNLSNIYTVQKDKIRKIVKDLISLDSQERNLIKLIRDIKPEIIHFQEIPETFISVNALKEVYNNREYKIFETTHNSLYNPKDKVFFPDAFIFVSDFHKDVFRDLCVPMFVYQYPIENFNRPDRSPKLKELGLNPNLKHVLNVGLFTPDKNQKELFNIAAKIKEIQFHFVGNQADNFKDYWQPLMRAKPDNVHVWGERHDTDNFYSCMDLFYFPSKRELMPLCIKEALSWNMPIFMYNLNTYNNYFNRFENIKYLDGNLDNSIQKIKKICQY